jgi:filamentous hemagglutinin family protein
MEDNMIDNNKNYIAVGTSTKAFYEGNGKGRKSMKKQFTRPSLKPAMRVISTLVGAMLVFSPTGLLAGPLPTGAVVKKGSVAISTNGNTMTIDQATQKAIVHWDSFNIGTSNVVNVNQPGAQAAMLSRVVGGSASEILGRLSATGHFYLINPHGVLIGKDAVIDVNALIASTLNISDDNFLADKLIFEGSSDASVQNFGQINAEAAALIAQNVTNAGEINAKQVGLIGTQSVELGNFNGGKLTVDFSALADSAKVKTTVENAGIINATDEGDVVLYADAGVSSNETGAIIADTLEISGDFVDILNLGTLDVNSLLIDPTGTLTIIDGGASDSLPANWNTKDGNRTVTDTDLTELITNVGNLILQYDDFVISNAGDTNYLSVDGGTYNLTLQTNADTGTFSFNGATTFEYTGTGNLTISTGMFANPGNGTLISGAGGVTIEGQSNVEHLVLPGITTTAGGNLSVTSAGNVTINKPLTADCSVDIYAHGTIAVNNSNVTSNAGHIDMQAFSNLSVSNSTLSATNVVDGDILLWARDSMTLTNTSAEAGRDFTAELLDFTCVYPATPYRSGGNISITAEAANPKTIVAGRNLVVDNLADTTTHAGGNVTITNVNLTAAKTTPYEDSYGRNYLWLSGQGALNLTNSDLTASLEDASGEWYGEVSVGFNQGVTITNSSINAATLASINNVNMGPAWAEEPHSFARGASGNVVITSTENDTITARDDIHISNDYSNGKVELSGMTLNGLDKSHILIETWGNIVLKDSTLQTAWTTPDADGSGTINLQSHKGTALTNAQILAGTEIEIKNIDMFIGPNPEDIEAASGAITSDDDSTIRSNNASIFIQNVAGGGEYHPGIRSNFGSNRYHHQGWQSHRLCRNNNYRRRLDRHHDRNQNRYPRHVRPYHHQLHSQRRYRCDYGSYTRRFRHH